MHTDKIKVAHHVSSRPLSGVNWTKYISILKDKSFMLCSVLIEPSQEESCLVKWAKFVLFSVSHNCKCKCVCLCPDIPCEFSGLYTLCTGTGSFTISSPLGRIHLSLCSCRISLQFSFIHSTRYPSLLGIQRQYMELEVCLTLLVMVRSDLLSPMPCPPCLLLPHNIIVIINYGVKFTIF